MKRFLLSVVLVTSLALTSCQFDDSALWSKLDEYGESIRDHEQRISALEELCKQMNTNIEALQTLVDALEKRDYVTNVSEVRSNGEVIGYTISFAHSDTITIYHGKDGKDGANGADGKDGYTPQIGVMKDTDNIYYWTLDGEWLLDGKGNKIQANGVNGTDGTNGTNGVTPQLKIENDYWYVSYDNGATWQQLGKATGEDGTSGIIINVEEGESEVAFTLADGSTITLPKSNNSKIVDENNKIYYTSTDGKKLFPYDASTKMFGAILISNTYEDGQGILTFDDTVTSIGEWAFYNCTSLTSVTIPDSVTSIGDYAFSGCTSLTRVDITDLSAWCKISFGNSPANPLCNGAKLYLNGSELTDITIPSDITEINNYAFYGCKSLTSVTIPDSVTSIGNDAFYGCKSLTSVTIPNSVTSIGDYAFSGCTSLTSITIPDSVTSIGDYAFRGCTSLTSVTIPNSVTSIGNHTFYYCSSLTSVTIGNGVTSIGGGAFYGCSSLTSVTIGNSVTSIGDYAFSDCTSLTSITIPDSVTKIGSYAFNNCSLTSVTIPNSVTEIVDFAFCRCTSLTSITIPDSVTSIGYAAFFDCTSLSTVAIGNRVTSIGIEAFSGCISLTTITIPDSVTSIGGGAFCYCTSLKAFYGKFASTDNRCLIVDGALNSFAPAGLTEYTISDGVTSIGGGAFYGCSSLTSVTIGNSVTSIGYKAFYDCTSLTSVYCKPTTPPTFGSGALPINNASLIIYVPTDSVDAYKAKDGWKDYADYIKPYNF